VETHTDKYYQNFKKLKMIGLYCALEKRVQNYQFGLIKRISEKFGVTKTLIQDIEPHFTLKYPAAVDDDQLDQIIKTLQLFCSTQKRHPVKIGGFYSFDSAVVYTRVNLSPEAMETFEALILKLHDFNWLTWSEFDADNAVFHATLAEECSHCGGEILSYLADKETYFDTVFDNITMVQQTGEENGISKWGVLRRFELF
jgi:2'-5' RNA ligase